MWTDEKGNLMKTTYGEQIAGYNRKDIDDDFMGVDDMDDLGYGNDEDYVPPSKYHTTVVGTPRKKRAVSSNPPSSSSSSPNTMATLQVSSMLYLLRISCTYIFYT